MIELGSEYDLNLNGLCEKEDNFFSDLARRNYNYRLYDSGRSALRHIPFDRKGIVLLPEYICESVINCFESSKVVFYKIRNDLSIDINDLAYKITDDVRIVYIAHYFGMIHSKIIMDTIRSIIKEKNILLIEDTTQSLFSEMELMGDFAISSIRKWLPIPQGGVLYTRKGIDLPSAGNLEKNMNNERSGAMVMKNLFLRGISECNAEYRRIFKTCEEKFDLSCNPMLISDFAEYLVSCFDICEIKKKRKENYEYLLKALSKMNLSPICSLEDSDCPFVYPIRVKNRDEFRKYLIENRIYCAVHWPFDGIQAEKRINASIFSKEFISLPIDQRYGMQHMRYLVDVICNYEGELLC